MCGITGFLDPGTKLADARSVLARMTDTLRHRGPDECGIWLSDDHRAGLGHRRLSIIDLTREGRQPMTSSSSRYVISYNGEVYNFRELRRELEALGCAFRGSSDTEVILHAIEAWGLEAAVRRFIGMFAFALWDLQQESLTLVRDRLGIKPLYCACDGKSFLFASELKAMRPHPGFAAEIDRDSLTLLFKYSYINAPHCIYKGAFQLPPGHMLTVPLDDSFEPSKGLRSYWSAHEMAERGQRDPYRGSAHEAAEELDQLLRDAVERRMVADVPLGAFLSGGIDSSTVVALMTQAQTTQRVQTFSIGFTEAAYDEAAAARAVAEHLGTDHTELYVTPADALSVIPDLPGYYDEPFADSSQIPTYLLSRLTRNHVTVSLSGDGGDELFGGYDRYRWCSRLAEVVKRIPAPVRSAASASIHSLDPATWDRLLIPLRPFQRRDLWGELCGDRLYKLSNVLSTTSPTDLYKRFIEHWSDPLALVLGASEPQVMLSDEVQQPDFTSFVHKLMFADLVSYLPGDILTKVDRASMAVGLEARVPLLDHRVVEFAWRLPAELNIAANGGSKLLLRKILERYVPTTLTDRPKMGFGVPIDEWLRGPLRNWADDLLSKERLQREGFLNAELVTAKWSQHRQGQRRWHYHLWDVLMFEAWLDAQSRFEFDRSRPAAAVLT